MKRFRVLSSLSSHLRLGLYVFFSTFQLCHIAIWGSILSWFIFLLIYCQPFIAEYLAPDMIGQVYDQFFIHFSVVPVRCTTKNVILIYTLLACMHAKRIQGWTHWFIFQEQMVLTCPAFWFMLILIPVITLFFDFCYKLWVVASLYS
jgi:hypothetical protein